MFTVLHFSLLAIQNAEKLAAQSNEDGCRYKFHVWPLSWQDAHEICEGNNRTLAKLTNPSEFSLVSEMAKNNVAPRVKNVPVLETEMWIGLRGVSIGGTFRHLWEDCEQLTQDDKDTFFDTHDNNEEGCIAFDWMGKKFVRGGCNQMKPYICQAFESVSCYDTLIPTDTVFRRFTNLHNVGASKKEDCMKSCSEHQDKQCIAFQYISGSCSLYQYTTTVTNDGLNMRQVAYTVAFIDLTSHTDLKSADVVPTLSCSDLLPDVPSSPTGSIAMTSPPTMASSSTTLQSISLSDTMESRLTAYTGSLDGSDSISVSTDLETSVYTLAYYSLSSSTVATAVLSSTFSSSSTEPTPPLTTGSDILSSQALTTGINSTETCFCPCSMVSNKTHKPEELSSRLEKIRKRLAIDKKKTVRKQRSLISAPDERVSARNIGYVGVAILTVLSTILVMIDLPRCVTCGKNFIKKVS